jgi:hypothetical protein
LRFFHNKNKEKKGKIPAGVAPLLSRGETSRIGGSAIHGRGETPRIGAREGYDRIGFLED